VSLQPEEKEALPSLATVARPAGTLQPPRPRLVASLLSVRNWQQLGKFCVVGAVGYLINLAVYDALLHGGLHYLVAATCSFTRPTWEPKGLIIAPWLVPSPTPRRLRNCVQA